MTKVQSGARTTIEHCLRVGQDDRVLVITDEETREVGEAIYQYSRFKTQDAIMLVIEDYGVRPMSELPGELRLEIEKFRPTVSVYAAAGQAGELPVFRAPLMKVLIHDLNCRHAHMIGITKQLMEDGLNQDYERVKEVTKRLSDKVTKAKRVFVTDKYGTDMVYDLDPGKLTWVAENGIIVPGRMSNLPAGECFTSPRSASGTFVGWVVGDYLSKKYGVLEKPIKLTIENGQLTIVECSNLSLKLDFEKYVGEYENGKRVGELGIGTLVGLTGFVGNLLQDEKFPGVHMAFGHSYPEETGQTWDCPSHIDVIAKETTIELDYGASKVVVMREGKYIV